MPYNNDNNDNENENETERQGTNAQEHAGRGNAWTQDLADSDDDDDDDDDADDNDDYDIVGNIQSNAYDKQPKKIQQQQTPTSKDAVYI
ncbi:hypothetical protein ACLKA6_015260 [Drosophila palustris]